MSLDKGIKYKKEHRKTYFELGQYSKDICASCRNNNACDWCRDNRLHNSNVKLSKAKYEIREYYKEG